MIRMLGGELHWLVGPSGENGCKLTYGPTSALLHFAPRPRLAGLRVTAAARRRAVKVRVTRHGAAVPKARVTFAGASARTDRHGRATLKPKPALPGRFKALARAGGRYGVSKLVDIAP